MAETFFLSSLATYLTGAGLTPSPVLVGVAEPEQTNELPAIVLSLEATARAKPGIGERSQLIVGGVLPVPARIDLANPFLPEDSTFPLLECGAPGSLRTAVSSNRRCDQARRSPR